MRIQHNIMAMSAYRNYTNNVSAMKKNLEKLSSGYKINRAGDDAAGLAISEKMRAQITGLETAQKNAKDGISLVQTAEGALTEVHDMLNRMVELATMSANGTYDNDTDRAQLQKELDQLNSEINRIADSANFNGIKLLDGSLNSESISAVGDLLKDAMVDGTVADPAGKANITVQLSGGAGAATKNLVVDDTKTVQNKADPAAATAATVALGFKAGATTLTIGGAANLQDLGDVTVGGKKISELFTGADWTDTTTFTAATTINLTAINKGALSAAQITALEGLQAGDATATVTNGKNEGGAAVAGEYSHELTIDMTKLVGGQTLEIYGKKIAITTDGTTTAPTGYDAVIDINGLNANDTTGQTDIATKITAALNTALGTNVFETVTGTNTTTSYKATITAKAGQGYNGDLGVVRIASHEGATTDIASVTTTAYTPGSAAAGGAYASITYKDFDISTLKVGDKVVIGGKTVEIVKDDDTHFNGLPTGADKIKADTANNKAYVSLDVAKDATKLASAFQAAGYNAGRIEIDTTDKTLKITSADKTQTADALKTATAAKIDVAATSQKATATGGLDITAGTTTYKDLLSKAIDGTKTVGDLFTVKVNDTEVSATDTTAIAANAKIEFIAKVPGKIDDTVMAKVTYGGDASTTVVKGWDEGTSGVSANTHYELLIDPAKMAGGNAFTFGNVNGKSETFELSLDSAGTGNGSINTEDKDDVADNATRTQINVGGLKDNDAVAAAIQAGVNGKMGTDFDVKATVVDGKIKLTLDAKNATDATNLGNIRFSSQSEALTGAVYNPYNAANGGTEGTYAQVSYDFDIDNLASGDKLTIGDVTVTIGDKTETVKDANGTFQATLSEADARDAAKLVAAFESSGYTSGQLKIADGKLTITGIDAGQKAEDLAEAGGKVSLTSTRKLTEGGLTLQIGDTADAYNQLSVGIRDMHAASLGLDKISIADQDKAAKAIDVIKDAINTVSDVRGTLGATQNRLDHTINNLSVMTENIQDAESTIRDTDVADEMMAYTKNNILIQSAQAMLAQANQVPQGVLQLLQ